jgi:predicted RecA/RadA family phage recombinase
MKYIKINTTVNLTSGLSIPSGSVVIIAEGYADVKNTTEQGIPSQIAVFVFASSQAMAEGKSPIIGIADFQTTFSSLQLSIEAYETKTAETLLVDAVAYELGKVYGPENIEILTTE